MDTVITIEELTKHVEAITGFLKMREAVIADLEGCHDRLVEFHFKDDKNVSIGSNILIAAGTGLTFAAAFFPPLALVGGTLIMGGTISKTAAAIDKAHFESVAEEELKKILSQDETNSNALIKALQFIRDNQEKIAKLIHEFFQFEELKELETANQSLKMEEEILSKIDNAFKELVENVKKNMLLLVGPASVWQTSQIALKGFLGTVTIGFSVLEIYNELHSKPYSIEEINLVINILKGNLELIRTFYKNSDFATLITVYTAFINTMQKGQNFFAQPRPVVINKQLLTSTK
ncbi:unnamed protein product [Rhizophagus irregularis]|uniref:Uncharacterized protein n=1 Tax=Rhizophagus irregularis TaxID=588596 RepID=A0A2I1GNW9_9GLOM|nr:hypothetical protein RhiirA4_422014 [Rhizophagus irregularis]CAB4410747.1 unnamed protein product [Rhizophagus irregularis]